MNIYDNINEEKFALPVKPELVEVLNKFTVDVILFPQEGNDYKYDTKKVDGYAEDEEALYSQIRNYLDHQAVDNAYPGGFIIDESTLLKYKRV